MKEASQAIQLETFFKTSAELWINLQITCNPGNGEKAFWQV
jgi:plasmid maintenance system antidote protein VapI